MEFLRIIFTVGVLCYHFFPRLELWNRGCYGVVFFFILSGFLLHYTFSQDKTVPNFIIKKLVRFVPLIIFGSLLRILFVSKIDISMIFADLFLMPATGLYGKFGYNTVSWYIQALFWVSLFYFYLFKTKKKENVNLMMGLFAFFGLVAVIKRGIGINSFLGDVGDIGYIFNMQLIYCLSCMALGYWISQIYNLCDKQKIITNASKIFYTVLEAFVLSYSILLMFIKKLYPGNIAFMCISFSALIILFLLKRGWISQFFEKSCWKKISKYCLAIYLVQCVIVYDSFGWVLAKYSDFMMGYKLIAIFVTILCCFIVGILAHYLVEIPCYNFFAKWFKGSKNKL